MNEELIEVIKRELPTLVKENKEIRDFILKLSRNHFADKRQTEGRIEMLIRQLEKDREITEKRFEESKLEFRIEQEKQNKKWEENQKGINEILYSIKKINTKHESTTDAICTRWGLYSEESFRRGLSSILRENFKAEVINYNDFDKDGFVFGRPEQIELDIIIKNGLIIIAEIKSWMSKPDMYIFHRKVQLYENKTNCKASRYMVISPMIDAQAKEVANSLGIECFSYAEDVI